MEAGRELDALVSEKVFSRKNVLSKYPLYSTDIGAAWLVVEKIDKLVANTPNSAGFYCMSVGDPRGEWLAGWGNLLETDADGDIFLDVDWDTHAEDYGHFVYANTAPLAICLAALKVVGAP